MCSLPHQQVRRFPLVWPHILLEEGLQIPPLQNDLPKICHRELLTMETTQYSLITLLKWKDSQASVSIFFFCLIFIQTAINSTAVIYERGGSTEIITHPF